MLTNLKDKLSDEDIDLLINVSPVNNKDQVFIKEVLNAVKTDKPGRKRQYHFDWMRS